MEIFFIGILVLVLGAVGSLFFNEKSKLNVISTSSVVSSLLLIYSALTVQDSFYFSIAPFGNVLFVIDDLSAFFVIVISSITMLVSIYSVGYLKPYIGQNKKFSSHCFFFPMLTAAMLLVVTVQNLLLFLVLWEVMSLSSFFLILFEDDKKEVIKSGIKYLIYMHISVIFIIAAFALMSVYSGSYEFSSLKDIFVNNPYLKDVIFVLAFIGFGTKAGFVPMHNWLPDAHPSAPSHVSAVMSAVMIKTGIYGILRVLWFIEKPTLFMAYLVLSISVITALYGITYAVNQKNIKKLLAYSSIENIGLIGLALSIVMFGLIYEYDFVVNCGLVACFMHILNHSVFKSLLFMAAGSIYLKTHTKDMELLGGLIKKMPVTAVCFLIGSVAICAFPPLNGFISEFMMYAGLFNLLKTDNSILFISAIFALAALAFVGTLVILAMSKVYSITFLGLPRTDKVEHVDKDVDLSMKIPMIITCCLALLIGVASPIFVPMVPFSEFLNVNSYTITSIYELVAATICISLLVVVFIIFTALMYFAKTFFFVKSVKFNTWGCGYDKGNNHIQYTGSSYVSPFTSILTPLFKKIFDVKKPKGFFPKDAHYESSVVDVEEAYIINPVLKTDEKFLSKFERLQDGNIQHYILYGLIFLILMLLGVVVL